jgi:hypothetical protein
MDLHPWIIRSENSLSLKLAAISSTVFFALSLSPTTHNCNQSAARFCVRIVFIVLKHFQEHLVCEHNQQ